MENTEKLDRGLPASKTTKNFETDSDGNNTITVSTAPGYLSVKIKNADSWQSAQWLTLTPQSLDALRRELVDLRYCKSSEAWYYGPVGCVCPWCGEVHQEPQG